MDIKTDIRKSFMELCISGEASPDDIYQFIREWHESDSTESLEEYLGMTFAEYATWVEDSKSLVEIIAIRKKVL